MAPTRGRKRPADSPDSHNASRPSPHRPEDSNMAYQSRNHNQHQGSPFQNRGRGRGGRGRDQPRNQRASQANSSADRPTSDRRPIPDAQVAADRAQDTSSTAQQAAPTRPPQQSASATPQPQQQPPPPAQDVKPRDPPRPYSYELLTEEAVKQWQTSGRDSVIKAVAQHIGGSDPVPVCSGFQELLRAGLDGRLAPAEAGSALQDILALAPEGDLIGPSLFLDTLSTVSEYDPIHPHLKDLVLSTGVSADLMREVLDEPILQSLGLIRSTFGRVFIRKQTNVLYRQSNYNLLREETEGYSKLMTELFTTVMSGDLSGNVVQQTFEHTKALIGAFDLDAGRVLDVTLDIFASLLVKQFRFFVKYLRTSSFWPPPERVPDYLQVDQLLFGSLPTWAQLGHLEWVTTDEDKAVLTKLKTRRDVDFWDRARDIGTDAYFELGGRRVLDGEETVHQASDANQSESNRSLETRKWIEVTKTLPPRGNEVAAQLLGFKLCFYAASTRDATDILPDNLIYLAALLIKIGFISLRDLYTHLYPDDDKMEVVREKKEKDLQEREKAKRGGGTKNALAMAGALADDTVPQSVSRLRAPDKETNTPGTADAAAEPAAKTERELDPLPEPVDQKIELLKSLLCIGAIPEALYILGRFPWLYDLVPDLPRHFHRILHYSLSKVCERLNPLADRPSVKDPESPASADQAGVPKGQLRLQEARPRKTLRWAKIDSNDVDGTADYRFYWDDWSDNVPVCQDIDDVFTLCDTLLNFSGVKIGQDPALLSKLARLGTQSLTDDPTAANESRWVTLCKRLLCPALSLTKSNPGVANDLYALLRLFPTHTRYSIYSEWFHGPTSRNTDVAGAFAIAKKETSDLVKRMSKTNIKQMAQALAKITHGSPGVVFDYVLKSIESYDNMIEVVVECARYFTYMGYDVLTWSLISTLGRSGRERIAATGYEATKWLVALSSFTGKVFKRYGPMQTVPVLQYIAEQLRQENFTDLRVLRELISNMAGITPDTDFSDTQVQAMAGGELLQAEVLKQIHDRRHESTRSGKRLAKAVVDGKLVGPLLISIAIARQLCIDKPKETYLKIISENHDEVHISFIQYLDMLATNLDATEFEALVPDVVTLITSYSIDPSIAFMVHRKGITRAIADYDAEHAAEARGRAQPASGQKTAAADVEMADDTVSDTVAKADPVVDGHDVKLEDEEITEAPSTEADKITHTRGVSAEADKPWHPVLEGLTDRLRPVLGNIEANMSMSFFTTFWQLSLQDIMAPTSSYEEEIRKLREKLTALGNDRGMLPKPKDAEKAKVNDMLAGLTNEMKHHVMNYQIVRKRLVKEKNHWFKDYRHFKLLNAALLQECFLPRMLLSPMDAAYAQKMMWYLHSSGAPGFTTMHFIEALLSRNTLTNLIFQCTSREVENLGRFINEILRPLTVWHGDKDAYERLAYGARRDLSGFAIRLSEGKPSAFIDHVSFRKLFYKWHQNIYNTLESCMKLRGEYMHMKNAISFFTQISDHFPRVNWMSSKLGKIADEIAKDELEASNGKGGEGLERQDVHVAANSLRGILNRGEKNLVMVQAFRDGADDTPADSKSNGATSKAITEKVADTTLNIKAPEFKPGVKAAPLQISAASGKTKSGRDVEDGELADSPKVAKPEVQQSDSLKQTPLSSTDSRRPPGPPSSDFPVSRPVASSADSSDSKPADRFEGRGGRNTPLDRPTHGLPDRPNFVPGRGRPSAMSSARLDGPIDERLDPRSRYAPAVGRLDRSRDLLAEEERRGVSPGRLGGPNDRVGPPPEHYREREPVRPFDRTGRPYPDDGGRPLPRDIRSSQREPLPDYPHPSERPARFDDRPSRPDGRSRSDYTRDSRDVGPPPQSDLASVNPARAAQISGDMIPAEPYTRRPLDGYPAPHSVPASPGHGGDGRAPTRPSTRDERTAQRPPTYESRRDHSSDYPPSGPRDARPPRNMYNDDGRSGAPVPPRDAVGARYAQEPSFPGPSERRTRQPQDPNYGRLSNGNGAEPNMPPSPTGPRSQRQTQGPGNFNSHSDSRSASYNNSNSRGMAPPRTSDRFAGPSQSQPLSAPGTPTPAFHGSSTAPPQQQPASTGQDTSGVHPSRLAQLPVAAPSGPGRGAGPGTPTGPASSSSGPSARGAPGSGGGGDDRRRMQGLQDTLQQAQPPPSSERVGNGDQGASIRGMASATSAGGGANGEYERHRGSRAGGSGRRSDVVLDADGAGSRHREARERRGGSEAQGYDSGRERRGGGSEWRGGGGGGGGVPEGRDDARRESSGGGGGGGRKRDWNGDGPQGGGEKRPRRSGAS